MKHQKILKSFLPLAMIGFAIWPLPIEGASKKNCIPLVGEDIVKIECVYSVNSNNDTFCNLRLRLVDEFKGSFAVDNLSVMLNDLKVTAVSPDTVIYLDPMLDRDRRTCDFVSEYPIKKGEHFQIHIPEGLLKVRPDMVEVDEIDIDENLLSSLSVAGAWHKAGGKWTHPAMFSVIDDDSLDGQIPTSKHVQYTYGYYSLLYPLLESIGIRGNLAVLGRNTGLDNNPPFLNDNGKTVLRLQDEKGWDILCHSMECLGENLDNWLVDSLSSPLAHRILEEGPNYGFSARTVSVYDLKSGKQYWPVSDNSGWEETPARFVKPYVGDFETKHVLFYNPDYDLDWHWGEWKRRAESYGMHPVGFVTHDSSASHAHVPRVREVFPYGLSDVGAININYPPMLSSGVRAGLEGQSLGNYDGNSKDNTFNETHYKKFCAQVDEALEKGGWIVFNLHTYRDCWKNSLPGKLVSEGGDYPDEWVIPMKGMDSANDPLTPPAHLGITEWSEWYPCPGTRLEMMWKVLKYAQEKGLENVTCGEGFDIMGNKANSGYYNRGCRFGKDYYGLMDTDDIYPHYVVSATDEISYYNYLTLDEYTVDLDDPVLVNTIKYESDGKFLMSEGKVVWNCPDPSGISLTVLDSTGKKIASSGSNAILLDKSLSGMLIICAVRSGAILGSLKIVR